MLSTHKFTAGMLIYVKGLKWHLACRQQWTDSHDATVQNDARREFELVQHGEKLSRTNCLQGTVWITKLWTEASTFLGNYNDSTSSRYPICPNQGPKQFPLIPNPPPKKVDNFIFLIENKTVATNTLSMPLSMNLTTFTFILLTKYLTSSL